jgi:flagellar FliL protein
MEENKMSNKVLIIILGVVLLMMAMMGTGFFILWSKMSATVAQVQGADGSEQAQQEEKEKEASLGPLYKMETLIVNLADQGGKRYLRVTMELELSAPEVVEEIEKRMPQLRDAILMVLPTKQYADISTTQGKIALRDEILVKMNGFLKKGSITTIYFTEFVVQ